MTENTSAKFEKLAEASRKSHEVLRDERYIKESEGEDWAPRGRKTSSARLIGMGGLLGAGKDVAADHLVSLGWVKMGMSDPLNDALTALNPYIPAEAGLVRYSALLETWGYTTAKQIPEVRRLLQALGTEVGRNMISESVWTDIAARNIIKTRAAGTSVVITGMRFPNELALIKSLGGLLVWVDRPNNPLTPTVSTSAHASENTVGQEDFDTVLSNSGTLEDLYRAAEELA